MKACPPQKIDRVALSVIVELVFVLGGSSTSSPESGTWRSLTCRGQLGESAGFDLGWIDE